MKVLKAEWMRELDSRAIEEIGIPSIVLMENASRGAADYFAAEFPLPQFSQALVLAGKGNNGGDGIAIGRILKQKGYLVRIFLFSSPDLLTADPALNLAIAEKLGLDIIPITDSKSLSEVLTDKFFSDNNTFIVDALFGTGLNKPLDKDLFAEVIQAVNASGKAVAAVDIPSGLSEFFLPEEGSHLCADITATFQFLKSAHIHPDGNRYCGRIRVIDIGIPAELAASDRYWLNMILPDNLIMLRDKRPPDSHKGDFGHCLNISGSIEKPGAGILSGFAVLRSGAGLCSLASLPENRTIPIQAHSELMTIVYRDPAELIPHLPEFDTIIMGPGLGTDELSGQTVATVLQEASVPLILDADALNILSKRLDLLKTSDNESIVLTPHLREFSRLCGHSLAEIIRDRIKIARQFAQDFGVYLVLKGHHSLLATPTGMVYLNMSGNPGMATAGSGDVLSGVLAGLICQFKQHQKLDAILQAGIFCHGYAGDLAAEEMGEISLTASDILNHLPQAFTKVDEFEPPFEFA